MRHLIIFSAMAVTAVGYVVYFFVYPFALGKFPDIGDTMAVVLMPVIAALIFAGMFRSEDVKRERPVFGYWAKVLFVFYVLAICDCIPVVAGCGQQASLWPLLINVGLSFFAALVWEAVVRLNKKTICRE